jgi:hypothetical protein
VPDFYGELQKRAQDEPRDGETKEQAFLLATSDADGVILFQHWRRCPPSPLARQGA